MTFPKTQKGLAPINTHWHNRSLSSVASDAATFHSAHAQPSVEMKQISPDQSSTPRPQSPQNTTAPPQRLEATTMARQDSGYAGEDSTSTSRRTSTSSSTRRLKPSKRSSAPPSTRPCPKRASRSTPSTARLQTTRPHLSTRQTSPNYPPKPYKPSQFFQFPVLVDAEEINISTAPAPPPPPPATCQYWTSDSTRRLEYAAIDAASRGVKGFLIRLVPDCILPMEARRTRFHGEEESDAGSVRRYRLELPEEKEGASMCEVKSGLRRWNRGWRRGGGA